MGLLIVRLIGHPMKKGEHPAWLVGCSRWIRDALAAESQYCESDRFGILKFFLNFGQSLGIRQEPETQEGQTEGSVQKGL
ncbi:hypothetical protein DSECCO2_210850 [anaerobic digester metagenome]